ncbi:MAG: hypothetical protein ACREEE_17845, partial [Dongiaceae bacterium]
RLTLGATGGFPMPQQYTVGMTVNRKADHVNVEADDALMAALKVKLDKPSARINYVRPRNKRGDRRHPSHEMRDLPG